MENVVIVIRLLQNESIFNSGIKMKKTIFLQDKSNI